MNKKELIKKIEALPDNIGLIRPHIDKKVVLGLIRQLDEPQKVKVSEEEAKFLKTFNFRHDSDVTKALYYVSRTGFCYYLTDNFDTELKGLSEGFRDLESRKRLIRAILDGYEVEEEKRYWVKLKATDQYLISVKDENFLGFLQSKLRSKFTRKKLEDLGFSWVFDCPGIELEEVE